MSPFKHSISLLLQKGDTPSQGIAHVLVGGTFVVKNSQIVEGVMPGKAILGLQ